jgi:hypothetical protein
MAYEGMYEGDGFIRKGPTPKPIEGIEEPKAVVKTQAKPAKKAGRGRGITMFRFTRLVFGK